MADDDFEAEEDVTMSGADAGDAGRDKGHAEKDGREGGGEEDAQIDEETAASLAAAQRKRRVEQLDLFAVCTELVGDLCVCCCVVWILLLLLAAAEAAAPPPPPPPTPCGAVLMRTTTIRVAGRGRRRVLPRDRRHEGDVHPR
jgi:hypothetical protein